MDFGWCDIWEGWVSPFNHNSIPLFLTSILGPECSVKFWKSESRLFSVLILDGWHPDPSGLAQLFGWNSQVRWETTRDEERLFENCEPCKLKEASYLEISGVGNLSCTSKWLALSNQPLQCAIGPSLVNDDNAERIRGLDHTEHTALIIPRACQNMEGSFIVKAKSTGRIFVILTSLIITLFALQLTISYQSICRCHWMKNCKRKWLKQRGMRKSRISKSFCYAYAYVFMKLLTQKYHQRWR